MLFRTLRRPLPPRLRGPYLKEIVFERVYPRAVRAYAPSVYPGRILLFVSGARGQEFESDWADIAGGGIEVIQIPGSHLDLMSERAISRLAEEIAPRLGVSRN